MQKEILPPYIPKNALKYFFVIQRKAHQIGKNVLRISAMLKTNIRLSRGEGDSHPRLHPRYTRQCPLWNAGLASWA